MIPVEKLTGPGPSRLLHPLLVLLLCSFTIATGNKTSRGLADPAKVNRAVCEDFCNKYVAKLDPSRPYIIRKKYLHRNRNGPCVFLCTDFMPRDEMPAPEPPKGPTAVRSWMITKPPVTKSPELMRELQRMITRELHKMADPLAVKRAGMGRILKRHRREKRPSRLRPKHGTHGMHGTMWQFNRFNYAEQARERNNMLYFGVGFNPRTNAEIKDIWNEYARSSDCRRRYGARFCERVETESGPASNEVPKHIKKGPCYTKICEKEKIKENIPKHWPPPDKPPT